MTEVISMVKFSSKILNDEKEKVTEVSASVCLLLATALLNAASRYSNKNV